MQAVSYTCYGGPEVLTVAEVEKPAPAADELLVRVRAAAVNPLDWHYMRGSPYIMRLGVGVGAPDRPRLGVDFAGTVEAVGAGVTRFKPGDAVTVVEGPFAGINAIFEAKTGRERVVLLLELLNRSAKKGHHTTQLV